MVKYNYYLIAFEDSSTNYFGDDYLVRASNMKNAIKKYEKLISNNENYIKKVRLKDIKDKELLENILL